MATYISHDLVARSSSRHARRGSHPYIRTSESAQYAPNPSQYNEIVYVPRSPAYMTAPTMPEIHFTVNGIAGPWMIDIINSQITLDGAQTRAFPDYLRNARWSLDWPGLSIPGHGLKTHSKTGAPLTLQQLAQEISEIIYLDLDKCISKNLPSDPAHAKWNPQRIKFQDLRLLSFNYYQNVWIPILCWEKKPKNV